MALNTFDNGTELRKVRTDVINPLVEAMNTRFQDVIPVSSSNKKCIVDYRKYDFENPSHEAEISFTVPLDANEYPVRAVVHTKVHDTEPYLPSDWIHYNRTTQEISVEVDGQGGGSLFVEFWKEL